MEDEAVAWVVMEMAGVMVGEEVAWVAMEVEEGVEWEGMMTEDLIREMEDVEVEWVAMMIEINIPETEVVVAEWEATTILIETEISGQLLAKL